MLQLFNRNFQGRMIIINVSSRHWIDQIPWNGDVFFNSRGACPRPSGYQLKLRVLELGCRYLPLFGPHFSLTEGWRSPIFTRLIWSFWHTTKLSQTKTVWSFHFYGSTAERECCLAIEAHGMNCIQNLRTFYWSLFRVVCFPRAPYFHFSSISILGGEHFYERISR